MTIDEKYMRRCIQLARNGICHAAPNPMVGAVIVRDGKIIGEGYHVRCGEGHAEVNAIASVKDDSLLKDATIYVSLEPVLTMGKLLLCRLNHTERDSESRSRVCGPVFFSSRKRNPEITGCRH